MSDGSAAGRRSPVAGPLTLVGMMSGTSLDGISAAVARFHDAQLGGHRVELLGFEQRAYEPAERERLLRAMREGTPAEYCRLQADLGSWFADAAVAVLASSGVARADVAAIASHGQTIWHEPPHSTWQVGEAAVIAERTGLPVISSFRVRDVAAGGQGAPLVPMADVMLFASDERWRLLQNLGGIGNVTVVPPRSAGDADARFRATRAFDTGPGCVVIDAVVRALRPGMACDVDGRLALAGTPIDSVVDELLAHPYFRQAPPKSTGRELFDEAYVARFLERCRAASPDARDEDLVATAVELTARAVADAYARFVAEPAEEVLLSGGGGRNPALVRAIARHVAPRTVLRFDDECLDGEAKEAVAFAYLGFLHLRGLPGNVPSATGAGGPRVLGAYTPA